MMRDGTTWLVVNTASGGNDVAVIDRVRAALELTGAVLSRTIDVQQEPCPDRDLLETAGIARLAVFAGDGTISRQLVRLEGWEGEVLVLPGGTANLLSRALHGERDAEEIALDLGSMRSFRRNCILCSKGKALIEILAGPGATWSDVREDLREGDVAELAASAVEAVVQSTAGPMVRLLDPPLGREDGYAGVRLAVEGPHFEVTGYGAERISDYLRQGVALLRRDFREGPHDTLGDHRAITCISSDGSPIELMVDGERLCGAAEERFSLAELRVNLLAAQP